MRPADRDPERAVRDYDAALAVHLADLERFLGLAARQAAAAGANDPEALEAATRERDEAMSALLSAAAELAPLRQHVESLGEPWVRHDAWRSAAEARRRIGECLSRILAQDEQTLALLDAAGARRRAEWQEMEAASATLVAYRRSVAPPSRTASLLDHRG